MKQIWISAFCFNMIFILLLLIGKCDGSLCVVIEISGAPEMSLSKQSKVIYKKVPSIGWGFV